MCKNESGCSAGDHVPYGQCSVAQVESDPQPFAECLPPFSLNTYLFSSVTSSYSVANHLL